MKTLKIKIIDIYIIRKFLGTFFFCLLLILTIAVVFDFARRSTISWKSLHRGRQLSSIII